MVQAESSPSEQDGEVAAGTEAESARIVELLKEKRGGESLPFGDGQLAAVAEEMARDSLSATMLRERFLGGANMVDAASQYFTASSSAMVDSQKCCRQVDKVVIGANVRPGRRVHRRTRTLRVRGEGSPRAGALGHRMLG